jgi:hypothetical protein
LPNDVSPGRSPRSADSVNDLIDSHVFVELAAHLVDAVVMPQRPEEVFGAPVDAAAVGRNAIVNFFAGIQHGFQRVPLLSIRKVW